MKINVQDLIHTPVAKLWELKEDDVYEVTYDDGVVVQSNKGMLILDRYIYELYNVYSQKVNVPHTCSVVTILNGESANAKTITTCLNTSFKNIVDTLGVRYYVDKEPLLIRSEEINNMIFNDIIQAAGCTMDSIDSVDLLQIMDDPEIVEIHSKMENHPNSIESTYRALINWMKTTTMDNPLVRANRSGGVSNSQFNQCVGPRGFVTDLDRTVYGQAIFSGFIYGLYTLYESMAESRTAAKALNAAGTSIQTSEYASRRFQILAMVVTKPYSGDCGSDDYETVVLTKRLLEGFKGKWYTTEIGQPLKDLKGDETHLIGEKIYYRHVAGCKHPNRQEICTTCLGRVSENLLPNTNLGAECAMKFMMDVTQKILSFKHEVKSVAGGGLTLDSSTAKYLRPNEDNDLFVKDEVDLSNMNLVLSSSMLDKLIDALSATDSNVPMNKIGELDFVEFVSKDGKVCDLISVSNDDTAANITYQLLEYIKNVTYEVDEKSNYIIPMEDWDKEDPLLTIPLKEADVLGFIKLLGRLIEATEKRKGMTYREKLFRLVDLVMERAPCNIMILEVLSYATSVFNPDDGNYRLGRGSPDMQYANKNLLFMHRSKAQLLPYEKQFQYMHKKPSVTFSDKYPENHPNEVLFMPQEVLVDRYDK